MRVVVVAEPRMSRTPDGAVWTTTGPAYGFWARYLDVFDRVRVAARVAEVPSAPAGAARVDGDRVEVWPVPYYQGPVRYLLRRTAIRRALRAAVDRDDAVILRMPSPSGHLLAAMLGRDRHPYAVEVVGDPHDVFAPGAVRHPLRPALRWWLTHLLRRHCRGAVGAAYVTQSRLQGRYPVRPGATSTSYSSVDLPPAAFVAAPRGPGPTGGPLRLLSVGSLEQPYKGIDTLVEALSRLVCDGLDVRLTHVGGGRLQADLAAQAARRGVADRVHFTGVVPAGAAVRAHLDAADLFVLPSRTEGLPRALIEAMARGLPAVGSTAGGIPELLPPGCLVPPGDVAALATTLRRLLGDPGRMAAESARNLRRARDYSTDVLVPRRIAFYAAVRSVSEARRGLAGLRA